MAQTISKTAVTRFLPALALCLLASTAMSGGAQAGWFDFGGKTDKADAAKTDDRGDAKLKPAADLEGSIRQAQMLRLAGNYDEAIKHLSQLMLFSADDGRVVSEYGKTLAAMGRAQEAVNFLTRAQQLQGNDWTVYNALGVAYDQLDKQNDARAAYAHALALKPGEATVLSNYALSRMLAKDPDGAKALIARAQNAGGLADPKIARNIALVNSLAVGGEATPARAMAAAAPSPAPRTPVSSQPMPRVAQAAPQARVQQAAPFVNIPSPPPTAAPRVLQPAANNGVIQAQPQMMAQQQQPRGVVMQRVPEDPYAGPVISATRAPRMLAAKPKAVAKNDAKPASAAEDLQAKAEAIAKTLNGKPAAIAQAKAEASRPAPAKPAAPLPKAVARVEMSKPAETRAAPVKAAAKKDAIPALRLSANTF